MNQQERIYLDNNSTTSLDPRVFKAMLKDLSGPPANPSSAHFFGQQAKNLLIQARHSAASFFQAKPDEILFTSGGTEALNMMLRGLKPKGHFISSAIEHSAMYKTLRSLETATTSVSYLPVGPWGAPLPEQIEGALKPDTQAIALSLSNGETGVKIDVLEIAEIARKKGVPLLLDCVSFVGKEKLPVHPGIFAMCISGHKFHGPKGVGVLFHRASLKLNPMITGGNQEYQMRAGTENLAGILGVTEALRILSHEQEEISAHLHDLRLHFERGLISFSDIRIHGEGPRISNTSNVAFLGLDGETLFMQLDLAGVATSQGSACSSGALEPSRVLMQMGIEKKIAQSSLRFSFGRTNTREEVDRTLEILSHLIKKLRS